MNTKFISKFVLSTAALLCAGALVVSSAEAGSKTSSARGRNVTVSAGGSVHGVTGGIGLSASESTAESSGKGKGSDSTAGGGYLAAGYKSGCTTFGLAAGVSVTSASAH